METRKAQINRSETAVDRTFCKNSYGKEYILKYFR